MTKTRTTRAESDDVDCSSVFDERREVFDAGRVRGGLGSSRGRRGDDGRREDIGVHHP